MSDETTPATPESSAPTAPEVESEAPTVEATPEAPSAPEPEPEAGQEPPAPEAPAPAVVEPIHPSESIAKAEAFLEKIGHFAAFELKEAADHIRTLIGHIRF